MTPAQCRDGRALVNLSIKDLASAAVMPESAIWNYERGAGRLRPADLDVLQNMLERAGVEFVEDGVRMSKGGEMNSAGMVRRLAMVAASSLALTTEYARAEMTGSDMYQVCMSSAKEDKFACKWYFAGFLGGLRAGLFAGRFNQKIVCVPDAISPGQVAMVFEKYMKEGPSNASHPAANVALYALIEAFGRCAE